MPNTVIKITAEATGWHRNLRCESPELPDGWAVVPEAELAVLKARGGVVNFTVQTAPVSDYPDLADRRTGDRGAPYPVAAGLTAGTYVPPVTPEPVEPEPTDTEVLNALLGVSE